MAYYVLKAMKEKKSKNREIVKDQYEMSLQ